MEVMRYCITVQTKLKCAWILHQLSSKPAQTGEEEVGNSLNSGYVTKSTWKSALTWWFYSEQGPVWFVKPKSIQ